MGLRVVLVMPVFTVLLREVRGQRTEWKEFNKHLCILSVGQEVNLGIGCGGNPSGLRCVQDVPPSAPISKPANAPAGTSDPIEPGTCTCHPNNPKWDDETGKCYTEDKYTELIKTRTTTPKVEEKPTTSPTNTNNGATSSLKIGSPSGLLASLLGILGVGVHEILLHSLLF